MKRELWTTWEGGHIHFCRACSHSSAHICHNLLHWLTPNRCYWICCIRKWAFLFALRDGRTASNCMLMKAASTKHGRSCWIKNTLVSRWQSLQFLSCFPQYFSCNLSNCRPLFAQLFKKWNTLNFQLYYNEIERGKTRLPVRAVKSWSRDVTTKECPIIHCNKPETKQPLLIDCCRAQEVWLILKGLDVNFNKCDNSMMYGLFEEKMPPKHKLFQLIVSAVSFKLWNTRCAMDLQQTC